MTFVVNSWADVHLWFILFPPLTQRVHTWTWLLYLECFFCFVWSLFLKLYIFFIGYSHCVLSWFNPLCLLGFKKKLCIPISQPILWRSIACWAEPIEQPVLWHSSSRIPEKLSHYKFTKREYSEKSGDLWRWRFEEWGGWWSLKEGCSQTRVVFHHVGFTVSWNPCRKLTSVHWAIGSSRDMRDDTTEILFWPFLLEAVTSSSDTETVERSPSEIKRMWFLPILLECPHRWCRSL